MPSVEELTDQIISREGGYVNDPDDPGGATKYGITLAALARWRRARGVAGTVTPATVAALGRDEARTIYLEDYFRRPGIGCCRRCCSRRSMTCTSIPAARR